mmetsp:Transcript_5666/g.11831  ORF Transcript_5666/g.11831 Transcript_5666/m.11831 type:complete len:281 (-) Transcript_5666:25-867(-)
MLVVVPPGRVVRVVAGSLRKQFLYYAWGIVLLLPQPVERHPHGSDEVVLDGFPPAEGVQRDCKVREPVEVHHLQERHLLGVVRLKEVLELPNAQHRCTQLVPCQDLRPRHLIRDFEVLQHHHVSPDLVVGKHGAHGLLKRYVQEALGIAPVKLNSIEGALAIHQMLHLKGPIPDPLGYGTDPHPRQVLRPPASCRGGLLFNLTSELQLEGMGRRAQLRRLNAKELRNEVIVGIRGGSCGGSLRLALRIDSKPLVPPLSIYGLLARVWNHKVQVLIAQTSK